MFPFRSSEKLEPEFNVNAPVLRMPVLPLPVAPGARFAPLFTVTAPLIVPLPPRRVPPVTVPLLFTVTFPVPVPEPVVLFTNR